MSSRIDAGGPAEVRGAVAREVTVGMTLRDIEDIATGPAGRQAGGTGPVSVLVVDDSHVFRRGMVRAVEQHAGLRLVGEADGGEAALEAIGRLEPDVVLLDMHMPDFDGIEVLARLGEAAQPAGTPRVVLISAGLDDAVERRARAAGAVMCLSKAVSRADICAAALALARE